MPVWMWRDPATRMDCCMRMDLAPCGYVRIPGNAQVDADTIEVHGGVTFDGDIIGDGTRWIGFDCAHWGDGVLGLPGQPKSWQFVRDECTRLASQLHAQLLDKGWKL